jgi:hypothetical protein
MWGIAYRFGAMKPSQFAFKQNEFAHAMRESGSDHQADFLRCDAGHHDLFQGIVELGHQSRSALPVALRLERQVVF